MQNSASLRLSIGREACRPTNNVVGVVGVGKSPHANARAICAARSPRIFEIYIIFQNITEYFRII